MATLNTKPEKKNKAKKETLRVDFTPMVDMNMLLITFFMFCTTLCIPQAMDIAMPAQEGENKIPESGSITLILGESDKVYYYTGVAESDSTALKETTFDGLRKVLLTKNTANVNEIYSLKMKRYKKEITDAELKDKIAEVKKSKKGLNLLIKATNESNYKNLVDALDEMQICGIGKYAIVDIEQGDKALLNKLKERNMLTAIAQK